MPSHRGSEALPGIIARRPRFGPWAPATTCILWCSILAGWIAFGITHSTHSERTAYPQDYQGTAVFLLMLLASVLLFVAGLAVLAAAAVTHVVRVRQYEQSLQAVAGSTPVPPPPPASSAKAGER